MKNDGRRELLSAFGAGRIAFALTAIVSGLINLLMLAPPLFMLQVYDRVLPSRSVPTLVALCLLVLGLLAFQAVLETLRARLLTRVAQTVDETLHRRLFDEMIRPGDPAAVRTGRQALLDLDTLRSFLASPSFAALFDLPWMPLYLAVCFAFHPAIGAAVLGGVVILSLLVVCTERMTRASTQDVVQIALARRERMEETARNVDLIAALGMRSRMADLWGTENARYLGNARKGADLQTGFGSLSRFMRTALQSGVLALGAWLVIHEQATAGIMLAATILSTRALGPVDLVIANWRAVASAWQARSRIEQALTDHPVRPERTPLPTPSEALRVTSLSVTAPGTDKLVVHNVSIALEAGQALGVIGPSGSGKSSLGRALAGIWPAARGVIRLDGASLDQWEPDALGRGVGYLPQDVELIRGSVADTIARFAPDRNVEALMTAAKQAGVHDLIVKLPQGYDTAVGEGGSQLSGGQRQRIALARALYGAPFLVVLDEPNSNLDADGERALCEAVVAIKKRGGIVVVMTHRTSVLSVVDQILVMNEGQVQLSAPRDAALARLGGAAARPAIVRSA